MEIKIKTARGQKVLIKKEATDPECMRVSIGGNEEDGYYLVFRGDDMIVVENMLEDTLDAFRRARIQLRKQSN